MFVCFLWQGLLYQFELSTASANFSCGHELLLQIAPDDVFANGKKDVNNLIIQIHFNSRQLDKLVRFLVVNPLMSRDPNEGDIVKFNPTFQALVRSVNSRTKMFIYSLSIRVSNVHVGVN
ncbi:eco57i restriction endonuclease [Lasius niger]|uniref:Eco57i restriction endonuclease n=1 Tax=Lasius niger TaxID=67767 RepID=A0A0J7N954_LASNI|nr:eco57i restriction endonuclease [Lasius niger]